MRNHGKRPTSRYKEAPTSRYKEAHRKTIMGTRFHELFFTPLPPDANPAKVQALLQPTGVQCKDVRLHKGVKGISAFVVFHCDADAAAALKAFRTDPLFIENKRIEVRYTMNYSNETINHSQQVTARIKQAFSWMTEHNISARELPNELETLVGTTYFTDIDTNFTCKDRHTECAFFSHVTKSRVVEESHDTLPVEAPESVIYKPNEILQLYKKSQEPANQGPKVSKSSKKKSAKKRQALAKIEAELTRQANIAPLEPGMGRGFCQQRPRISPVISQANIANLPISINKPCAVICPTKRQDIPTFSLMEKFPEASPEKHFEAKKETHIPRDLTEGRSMFLSPEEVTNKFSEHGKEKSGLPESRKCMGRGRGYINLSADKLQEFKSKF